MEHLLERFRDVMSTQQQDRTMGGDAAVDNDEFAFSPFVEPTPVTQCVDDDQTELMRLLDEVTHNYCNDDTSDTFGGNSQQRFNNININNNNSSSTGGGGFIVEEASGPSRRSGSMGVSPAMIYSSPLPGIPNNNTNTNTNHNNNNNNNNINNNGSSPFSYAGAISHISKPPPPSFAEAIATATAAPATPAAVPVELSPLAAHYVPPMPAAQPDPILLRNEHGVFLLQPVTRPTPPYTPPSLASPISPLPRYALPPAAGNSVNTSHNNNNNNMNMNMNTVQSVPHFLGSSLAQAGGLAESHGIKKSSISNSSFNNININNNNNNNMNNTPGGGTRVYGGVGGSHVLSTSITSHTNSNIINNNINNNTSSPGAGAYTYLSTSVKTKSVGQTPPPPYPN